MDVMNPSEDVLNDVRLFNLILGFFVCWGLVIILAIPRWKYWNVSTRLAWMALLLTCVTGTYGTFEVRFLTTEFRVYMVTVALLWAAIACLWPLYERMKGSRHTRKR